VITVSRITEYGLLAVVGMGFSTIASVQAGDPLPVVASAVTAGAVIAINHVREHRRARDDQEATDGDVEPDDDQGGDPLGMFDDDERAGRSA